MRTLLDEVGMRFPESLAYGDELEAVVVEAIAGELEELEVAGVRMDSRPPEVRDGSRRVRMRFGTPVAWQVVDESCTARDEREVRDDDGFLSVLADSPYLRHVREHHGPCVADFGAARHYRLWTGDDVVDVVAAEPPALEALATAGS